MKKLSLLAATVLCLAPNLIAEDWPRFRGPTGQGLSTETGLPRSWNQNSNVVWKTKVPGAGWSSPIVWGDRVFVTAAAEDGVSFRVLCLERATGKVLWNQEAFRQTLTHKEGKNSYATPTPVTDGQRVYVLSFNGKFAALTLDGALVWTNRDFTFYSQHGIGVSPILHDDLLIAPFDGSNDGEDKGIGWHTPWDKAFIVALDKRTGQLRWRASRGASRLAHPTPVVWRRGPGAQLISNAGDVVQGFDLKTGERLWSVHSQGEGVVPSPVLGEDMVFTASGFGKPTIRAVRLGGKGDATATHIAWELPKNVPMMSSFLYVKPWLFTVNDNGMAMCLKADTGEILWQQRLAGNYSASPVYADGQIYFLAEDGLTTIIEAKPEFKVVTKNPLNEKCQASMAISKGRLFIRTEENLYCIGTPE